jgi:ribosomal protein S14
VRKFYELKKVSSLEEIKKKQLPKNSAANRVRNRCWKTGRPRGYFRYFDCVET